MEPEQIRLIEDRYQACWNCIQAGVQDRCRHWHERRPDFAHAGNIVGQVLAHIKRHRGR